MARKASVLADGLRTTESPRWRDGKLWFLDMPAHSLRTIDLDGRGVVVEKFEDRPSAFDFLPDGTPVVAFRDTKKVLRLSDHSLYADLSRLEHRGARFETLNDVVIDGQGRLYVDCYMAGRDFDQPSKDIGDAIAVVETNGEARIATTGVHAPNGLAVTPDGKRLIVAEPLLCRLAAYEIADDGSLADRHIFATVGDATPDGICIDEEGAIWSTGIQTGKVIRVHEGGEVSDSVTAESGHWTLATMLGGPERRHLFIATCHHPDPLPSWKAWNPASAFIEVVEVDVAGGGWPSN